jgi:hypothetical protein
VYLMFVNEGGYYYEASGTGVAVAVATAYSLLDGHFVACEEGEEQEEYTFGE